MVSCPWFSVWLIQHPRDPPIAESVACQRGRSISPNPLICVIQNAFREVSCESRSFFIFGYLRLPDEPAPWISLWFVLSMTFRGNFDTRTVLSGTRKLVDYEPLGFETSISQLEGNHSILRAIHAPVTYSAVLCICLRVSTIDSAQPSADCKTSFTRPASSQIPAEANNLLWLIAGLAGFVTAPVSFKCSIFKGPVWPYWSPTTPC